MAQVFLVDRDDHLRAVLRAALEGAGHTVTDVADDREAMRLLGRAAGPAVVFVDYTQLWPGGTRLAQAVVANPAVAGRHAYLLTTTDRLQLPPIFTDRATGLSVSVLLKPFALDTFLQLVEQAATSNARPG